MADTNWVQSKARRLLPQWYHRYQLWRLERSFGHAFEEAKAKNDWDGYYNIGQQLDWESREHVSELNAISTRKLISKARRLGIAVRDIPLPKDKDSHFE